MITVTLWLLIHIGEAGGNGSSTTHVVERFASQQECSRVLNLIRGGVESRVPRLRCIESTVVKP